MSIFHDIKEQWEKIRKKLTTVVRDSCRAPPPHFVMSCISLFGPFRFGSFVDGTEETV